MSYEIALQRIEDCKRTSDTKLDLRGLWLRKLPETIGDLEWLTELDLGYLEVGEYLYRYNFLTTLPESVTRLVNLTRLNLSANELSTLPENIKRLVNLTSLDLGNNQLSTLPESVTRLVNLTSLDLRSNRIRTLPEHMTRLVNLSTLNLRSNGMSMLPESVAGLVNLTMLDLSSNGLSNLPKSVTGLVNLTTLDLSSNRLSTLPEVVTKLVNLTMLNLRSNRLSTLLESAAGLVNLTTLDLSSNHLSTLPESVTKLVNLTSLNLWNTGLSTLSESMTRLVNLTTLNLGNNGLSTLPESVTRLVNLTTLNLGNNGLSTLPESVMRLVNLTTLDLSATQLSTLPESITELVNLTTLDLSATQLSTLPESVTGLVNLSTLDLSANRLRILPKSVTRLVNLTTLNLSFNFFSILSESVTGLVNLTTLNLSANQISTLPVSIMGLVNLTTLDLRSNGLSALPTSVTELVNLISLDLRSNRLSTLPESMTGLVNLTMLNLSANQISTLPVSVTKLVNLTTLNLSANQLSTLPESMTGLVNLTMLDLGSNRLSNLPESVTGLVNLTTLNLSANQISTLPESVTKLVNLTTLDLRSNGLSALPESVTGLVNLTTLNLSANQLSTLPESVTGLVNLTTLNLGNNGLSILPKNVMELMNLTTLGLESNRFRALPESVLGLVNLTMLNLSFNRLSTLPYIITRFTHLRMLDLRHNAELPIPPEFLQNPYNVQAVFDYLRERRVLLNEIKVLVVGEAAVGKTTLVSTLLGESIDIQKREPTPGIAVREDKIRVRDDKLQIKEREVLVHYWDFGGQEIMHNTHRLFLTTRSCYLLVLDATQNEESNKVVEWLKTIHLYAPEAPVILVINKWDKYKLKLNLSALEQHHPIAAVIETSCATKEGIERLSAVLQAELAKLPHLNDEIPSKWMEVRRQVGEENKDYLEYQEFERFCAEYNIEEGTYESVAELLHALGVLFTYSKDRTTRLTHVLNPNWVTGGIYPILNDSELLQGKGFVTDEDIARVLIPKGYPIGKHPFILSMMFAFELAYELGRTRYLVPDLLPKAPPDYEWNEAGALRFAYQYDFVPPGLFSRFVVRLREEVNPDQVWRTGVILRKREVPYAKVEVDTDAKRIEISIALPVGDYRDRRALLDELRERFERLHGDYPGLEVHSMVPIGNSNAFVDYADLLFWAGRGEYKQSSRIAGAYDVRELLHGISAQNSQYAPPITVVSNVEQERARRKRLLAILGQSVGTTSLAWELFLDSAGLIRYYSDLNFTLSHKDTCHLLVRTLERAGIEIETRKPALWLLMAELCERREGHEEDVKFLQIWMQELSERF